MADATDKASHISGSSLGGGRPPVQSPVQAAAASAQGQPVRGEPLGTPQQVGQRVLQESFDDLAVLSEIQDLSSLTNQQLPKFLLAKNRARFQRMLTWYKNKWSWLNIAPLSGVNKLFKQQTKELEGIRSHKLDYEMEIEMGALTPSQRSYKFDELKMCKAHEKLAVRLISKMQIKIKSGRR